MKKRILALLAGGVLATSATMGLAACGKKDNTLTVWAPSTQQTLVKELVADFLAENTDITLDIKVNVCGEDEAYANVSSDVEAAADVFGYANDQLINLKKAGGVAFIPDATAAALKTTNDPDSVEAGKIVENGVTRYYGYPYAADNTFFMYYNTKYVSEEQSHTVEDILAACKKSRKLFLFNMNNSGRSWYLGSFFYGAGGTYDLTWADNGTTCEEAVCNFDQKIAGTDYTIGQVAGKALIDLRADSYFLTCDDSVISDRAISDEIGAVITGTWNNALLQQYFGEGFAATECPTYNSSLTGEDYRITPFLGYKLMGVNPYSSHIEEAHRLAAYLTSEKAQQKRFEALGIGPSNNNVANSDAVKSDIALAAIQKQRSYSKLTECLPSDYWTAFDAFGTDIYGGLKFEKLDTTLKTLIAGVQTV